MSEAVIAPRERMIHVGQGEHHVSDAEGVVMTTILGSCIAACIRDPGLGLGGMNHFLLPEGDGGMNEDEARRYGVNAMEILINSLLRAGARRDRLEAKLFGGGAMFDRLRNIGAENAAFAKRFLSAEGIPVVGGDTGGTLARRIRYRPTTGQAMQRLLTDADPSVFTAERKLATPPPAPSGDLELF
ncbi:chemotaxis protein CheD [Caulobacter mirabilis]|uniref:Probable chemoreceptor glutamine deamidase CheD n=1 Tax=Caulobacter mirabilis TaxID=69666 RepID=A0A2D2B1P6_9CAUL|nr:chemotaxis protein CheD [Caulobacter mirabilis]ATQ44185.1 chemotaxis protein CheD [Caulobacter mirabilis]